MSDGFDALFADEPTTSRKSRPRLSPEEASARIAEQSSLTAAASGRALADVGGVQALRRPVTINTLATIFEHDVQTVTRRLINCPYVEQSGRKLYDFKTAVAYIIKPKMTAEQFVRTMNRANLPPEINLAFWNAQRAKIKYMIEAGEAWETADVLEVFGETFMRMKDHLQMAEEEMRERAKLTDEQAVMFSAYLDELRTELREKLLDMPAQKQTKSLLDKQLFGTAKDISLATDPLESDPNDEFGDDA